MRPCDQPKEQLVAATDEFFKDQPVLPEESPAPDDSIPVRAGSEAPSAERVPGSPPLQDYVRELQQEFTEQEQEGKL